MADKRDYYQVLEVDRNASTDEIRSAYRRLAKQFHPDINTDPGAEERFKEINEAYAVLSNDERRAAYDRFGHAGLEGMQFDFDFGFGDIFEQFFGFGMGGRRRRRAPRRGTNLRYDLTLSFEEAVFGTEKEIEFTRQELCPSCQGSGAEPGTTPVRCQTCNGTGEVQQVRQTLLGSMVNVSTCPNCGGLGEIVNSPCHNCTGAGRVRNSVQRVIPIPAGVDSGTQIRVSGEGEPGYNGGPHGDLYVAVQVKSHRYFRRRDHDILLDLGINIAQATLGANVKVPTLDGEETLTIPPGTQPGKVLRLKGKGVPRLRRNGRGDQLVMISIEIPRSLSEEQRTLLEKLAATMGAEVHPQERGFLDSIREILGGLLD
jgi:molecular chaperone DnaJ